MSECSVLRIRQQEITRKLHSDESFADSFVSHILKRNARMEEDLIDQLFNSTEKRLARTLLLLAQYGKSHGPRRALPKVSQEILAEMVGTTRPRVNFFMNKFRKLGFIEYDASGVKVNNSLLGVVLAE
jgi:CRP-like cAMP-binding protein